MEEKKRIKPYYVQVDGMDVPTAECLRVWMSTKEDRGAAGLVKGIAAVAFIISLLSAALSVICLAGVI